MNIKILQSIAAGIISLSLIASCSNLLPKKESQTCGGKDGCNSTKNETIKNCFVSFLIVEELMFSLFCYKVTYL
jgi:hypothetical protein